MPAGRAGRFAFPGMSQWQAPLRMIRETDLDVPNYPPPRSSPRSGTRQRCG